MTEIKCPKCGTVISLEQSDLDSIVKQVRDEEFAHDLEERVKLVEAEKKREVELAEAKADAAFREREHERETELEHLRMQLATQQETYDAKRELAVAQAVASVEKERDALAATVELNKAEMARAEASFKEQLAEQAKSKDDIIAYHKDQIEQLKDMKARLSTKMVGESLEQHCQFEFDRIRSVAFPNAYFEKDNEAVEGTKGDFVFREEDEDGNEIISIMFEMKNESDSGSVKKKNEDHFAKLDKDRNKKKCEYAILVSLLEPESELYNQGIVDVSHRFPKMFVVRPQFFIPIISLLRNAALSSLEYKRELALVRKQDLDITNFESDLEQFKEGFYRSFKLASDRFEDAIEGIDKTIKMLEKIRDNLTKSENRLEAANNKLEGLTVKKLTRNNPTMKAKFKELEEGRE